MPDEGIRDERVQDPEQQRLHLMKTEVFRCAVDSVYVQLRERFQVEHLSMVRSMTFFTPAFLLTDTDITEGDIKGVCDYYQVDTSVIVSEMTAFRAIYKQLESHVNMEDLTKLTRVADQQKTTDILSKPEDELDTDNSKKTWVDHGFIKPLRLMQHMSGFTNLQYMYKILVTLPVTSCSAERAMSRVRIIKNRLRTTMLDDWFSSLLCLASEKDILSSLELNDIVDRFANCSDNLRRQLMYA